ncbi:MAG: phage tail sheath family protein [Acidobacteria bacterium]|nr:phage tail sheath family protein [Acidobacteriota bacterium]
MDIPVFAGFAASGPLHLPVAVEDVAQFAMIFGGDVELPRPRQTNGQASDPRYAQLAPCVRAFFRNGGRRCWVVRVAGEAVANTFVVPGLMQFDGVALTPAIAIARSEGSWSDALRVKTNLNAQPLRFVDTDLTSLIVAVTSTTEVAAGDLVRLAWSDADETLYLFVESVDEVALSPLSATLRGLRLGGTALWTKALAQIAAPVSAPAGSASAAKLTFDLSVRTGDATLRATALGFTPQHPRAFSALPTDAALYAQRDATRSDLWRDAATPRFALAAQNAAARYVPLGMSILFSNEASAQFLPAPALERDGLADFGAALFLDPHLADADTRDLLDRADALRYQANLALRGIHSALGIEEATMLAAPDAVHRGWLRDADDDAPVRTLPASNDADAAPSGFVDCALLEPLPPPILTSSIPEHGSYTLTWNRLAGFVDELQEATDAAFSDAATILISTTGALPIYGHAAGDFFYRVRRTGEGRTSGWSNGIAVHVAGLEGFTALDDDDTDDPALAPIHRALLRMCAARADLVALLSLPRHYDDRRAIAYTASLAASIEPQALSYGALWHPWLIVREEDGALRTTTPDGATAGVIAARAIARGAWIAPANEALRGVVALTPNLPVFARQALQDAAVNLIRHEPAGFLCLDADTLSADPDLSALNVRRLLILVRRAALRAGNDYAFEPHGDALRNSAKRGFESLLASMYARGAFAGRNESSAFQVVTDDTINTPQSTDAGRFIAELRIAPSRPLSFLTIRLVQRGETPSAVEVA